MNFVRQQQQQQQQQFCLTECISVTDVEKLQRTEIKE